MQLPGTVEPSLYNFRFRLLMGAADVVAYTLLWMIVSRRRRAVAGIVAGTYVLTTVALEFVLFDRLDLLRLVFILAAFGTWLCAGDSPRAWAWRTAAYAAVGFGASYKVIPIVLLPLLVVSEARTVRRWAGLASRIGVCLLVMAAPFVLSYAGAGTATLAFLSYHASRGVEIGSTWATLMWLVSRGDDTLRIVAGSGSWELAGGVGNLFARLAPVVSMLFFAAMGVWAFALGDRFDAERAYLQCLLVIAGAVLVLDVLSVQYLLWALPVLMLAAVEVTGRTRPVVVIGLVCVIIAALTTVFFPLGMRYVVPLNPWVMSLLAVRNALYGGVVVWLVTRTIAVDRSRGRMARRHPAG